MKHNQRQSSPVPVVLLMPELLACKQDVVALHNALKRWHQPFRMLIRVADPNDLLFAEKLALLIDNSELLLAHGVPAPSRLFWFAHLPQGGTRDDIDEFAFALADSVLSDLALTETTPHKLLERAESLGKPIFGPNDPIPALAEPEPIESGLDPDAGGWRCWARSLFGRLEQGLLEVASFDFFNSTGDRSRGFRNLARCFWAWRPKAYFAPDECLDFAPDRTVLDPAAPLVRRFEALDRSAVHGAYIHRDLIWVMHLLAAGAVFAAVAGLLDKKHAVYPSIEVVFLLSIAFILFTTRRHKLHDRWIACRMAAEQLRIVRMCLPLMVLPPALITTDKPPKRLGHGGEDFDLSFRALAEVKRAMRDQGLPRPASGGLPDTAVQWLSCIVADQITYHQRNHRKLERAETALQVIGGLLFLAILVAVGCEMMFPEKLPRTWIYKWLPLLTAGGPALAAALHGAATRLGLVHRIDLSRLAERDLRPLHQQLLEIARNRPMTDDSWLQVRKLAFQAADVMGRENTSWHGQVRLQRDALPA